MNKAFQGFIQREEGGGKLPLPNTTFPTKRREKGEKKREKMEKREREDKMIEIASYHKRCMQCM